MRSLPEQFLKELYTVLNPEQIALATEELMAYSYDASSQESLPELVVFPDSREQISALLQLASRYKLPVVPRGAGSGMAGGAVARHGGMLMALSRLNRIVEIDPVEQIAVVQPGVITAELQSALVEYGLFYPPDPASREFCTIGGNVACGAGGPAAVKYGVTRDFVLGLEAVLADGSLIRCGVKTAKGVVGYDLTRLLVGSEGTLAVISEITLRLLPLPETKSTCLLLCRDMHQAAGLVSRILARLRPCTLEYLDHTALSLVKDKLPAGLCFQGQNALLIIEFDGRPESVKQELKLLDSLMANEPGLTMLPARSTEEAQSLWRARKSLSPASFKLRPHKISEDVVVPRGRIPELVAFCGELSHSHYLPIFSFGHAGDGNIHVNIMLDKSRASEYQAGSKARSLLHQKVLSLGGTLSGEHGIGISKIGPAAEELGEAQLRLMRQIKQVFDPLNILNPGKLFP